MPKSIKALFRKALHHFKEPITVTQITDYLMSIRKVPKPRDELDELIIEEIKKGLFKEEFYKVDGKIYAATKDPDMNSDCSI